MVFSANITLSTSSGEFGCHYGPGSYQPVDFGMDLQGQMVAAAMAKQAAAKELAFKAVIKAAQTKTIAANQMILKKSSLKIKTHSLGKSLHKTHVTPDTYFISGGGGNIGKIVIKGKTIKFIDLQALPTVEKIGIKDSLKIIKNSIPKISGHEGDWLKYCIKGMAIKSVKCGAVALLTGPVAEVTYPACAVTGCVTGMVTHSVVKFSSNLIKNYYNFKYNPIEINYDGGAIKV